MAGTGGTNAVLNIHELRYAFEGAQNPLATSLEGALANYFAGDNLLGQKAVNAAFGLMDTIAGARVPNMSPTLNTMDKASSAGGFLDGLEESYDNAATMLCTARK